MLVTKTFRFRLEPSPTQRTWFARYAGCCRFVFNRGLAARQLSYEVEGKTPSYAEQCEWLRELKADSATAWLSEIHSQVLQQSLKDLDQAYQRFFRRLKAGEAPGFPKFKKKGRKDSFRYPQGVKVDGGRVYLPKIGWVKYRESRSLHGRIQQATIKREGEHWFVSFACEVEIPAPTPVAAGQARAVGIDVGLSCFATLSNGTAVENPRFLKRSLAKLKRAQRRLSRMSKGSNNWKKQAAAVATLHLKVRNSRRDFAHRTSTAIVNNHDVIAVEDLQIKGMLKNRHLASAISDAGWGMFLTMLAYKSAWAGKHFVRIGRFEATTQMCSACGRKKPMLLSARVYHCEGCGLKMDRDCNASLNIRAAGLAVLQACGGA